MFALREGVFDVFLFWRNGKGLFSMMMRAFVENVLLCIFYVFWKDMFAFASYEMLNSWAVLWLMRWMQFCKHLVLFLIVSEVFPAWCFNFCPHLICSKENFCLFRKLRRNIFPECNWKEKKRCEGDLNSDDLTNTINHMHNASYVTKFWKMLNEKHTMF